MRPRIRLVGLIAVLALIAAACSGTTEEDTTTTAATTEDGGDGALSEYGEDPSAADMALVEKALGPVEPSEEESWNIILASVARPMPFAPPWLAVWQETHLAKTFSPAAGSATASSAASEGPSPAPPSSGTGCASVPVRRPFRILI